MNEIASKFDIFYKNSVPKISWCINKKDIWFTMDSKENYNKNPHPYYNENSIIYDFNSFGYRCNEFDLNNDVDKILTIGCSISLGVGIPKNETYSEIITKNLSNIYNKKIHNYNLSYSGVGSDYISRVLYQTIDVLKPKFIILLFSPIERMEHFSNFNYGFNVNHGAEQYMPRNLFDSYMNIMNDTTHCFLNFVKNFNFIHEILNNRNIPWFWGSWDYRLNDTIIEQKENLEKYINFNNTDSSEYFLKTISQYVWTPKTPNETIKNDLLARDWNHPGRLFNNWFAEHLISHIQKQNIFM